MQNQMLLEYKEKKDVINFYESQTETYDILDGFSYWEILYSEYKNWIEKNLCSVSSNIAELGCGTGLLTKILENKAKKVFGIDICEKFLKKASSSNNHHKGSLLSVQGDIKSVPLKEGLMDAVVCLNTLDHINDPCKVISEASRICKRDGLFLFDITSSTALEPFYRFQRKTNELGSAAKLPCGTVPYEWSIKADDCSLHKIKTYRHSPLHVEQLLRSKGFKILNKHGVHICTSLIPEKIQVNSNSRILSKINHGLCKVDCFLNKIPLLKNYSMYVIYACQAI